MRFLEDLRKKILRVAFQIVLLFYINGVTWKKKNKHPTSPSAVFFACPCNSYRDSGRPRKSMLADNFWFSLEVAGCQQTAQSARTQLPALLCKKHTLCSNWVKPQTTLQLESHVLKHIRANYCPDSCAVSVFEIKSCSAVRPLKAS